MISEQEAREAAKRLKQDGDDSFASSIDYRESATKDDDIEVVSAWALQELARREAEQAERAKPIDAEWCLANGAISMTPEFVFFRIPDGHNLNVYLDPKDPYVAYGSNSFPAGTTRGQLLDLLKALKGGES